jgi:hypothetical protein
MAKKKSTKTKSGKKKRPQSKNVKADGTYTVKAHCRNSYTRRVRA